MVLKPEPFFEAVEAIRAEAGEETPAILLTPQGRLFTQEVARELSREKGFILLCGHYEGVDERVREHLVQRELSIGDYVLTGGELAAMVVVDAVVRLLPGVLGSEEASREDSHSWGLLEYPQYTRPRVYRGWEVPAILLSGNHAEIARWRRQQAIQRTALWRPDLLEKAPLSAEERELAEKIRREAGAN
jgi:tRNA (guanine37-N1)-methyltransferase